MVNRFRIRLSVSVVGLVLMTSVTMSFTGCGSNELPTVAVTGKVIQNGAPVTGAQVIFRPEFGPAATGVLDSEGRFELLTYAPGDGAVVGEHIAIVVPKTPGMSLQPGESPNMPVSTAPEIPLIYQRHESSPLRFEVASGGNDFTLELLP